MPTSLVRLKFADLLSTDVERPVIEGAHIALYDLARVRAVIIPGTQLAKIKEQQELLDLAVMVVQKLRDGGDEAEITAKERAALALYVSLCTRPSLPVRGNAIRTASQVWAPPEPVSFATALRAVGRLDRMKDGIRHHCGTGTLVGAHTVLTNNHVVMALAGAAELEDWNDPITYQQWIDDLNLQWSLHPNRRPVFDLCCESGLATEQVARVTGVFHHHSTLDVALLRLQEPPARAAIMPLSAQPPVVGEELLWCVGYPAWPSGLDADQQLLYRLLFFADADTLTPGAQPASSIKRAAPGRYIAQGPSKGVLFHDASTLCGASGSAMLHPVDHCMTGLHFAGEWYHQNHAVALSHLVNEKFFDGVKDAIIV